MLTQTTHHQTVSHIVENQMRQWELRRAQQVRQDSQKDQTQAIQIKYIAISREVGSGGENVARILSELLGWPVYDKQVLDFMSKDLHVHTRVVESVDEKTIGWIEQWLTPIFTQQVGQLSYYRHLSQVLMVLASHGNAIILGRAAGLVLPREEGLSIRVTAPMSRRCQVVAQEEGLSLEQAKHQIEKADKTKRQFVKQFLKKDFDDCHHYDLVLNTDKLEPLAIAKLIWRTLDQRQPDS